MSPSLPLLCTLGPFVPGRVRRGTEPRGLEFTPPSQAAPHRELCVGSPGGAASWSQSTLQPWPTLRSLPETLLRGSLPIPLLHAPGPVQFRGGPPLMCREGRAGAQGVSPKDGPAGSMKVGRTGAGRCRWAEPRGSCAPARGPRAPRCAQSHLGPSPCGHCSGSGRLGSSLCAGRREGGGWPGPRPGMCVQECGCSGVGGRTREG